MTPTPAPTKKTIRRVLIANRGEIARRIQRTCRAMGIETVAVYSEADAGMPFVDEADVAVCVGVAAASESYLRIDKILEAAKRTGADAIHPGYGFLSENAGFAQAVVDAGLIFIGPSPDAIQAMGSKIEAKQRAVAAGVPIVPGYNGEDQSDEVLVREGLRVGFPLLVKASAGGGGKGMRAVYAEGDLLSSLHAARREAQAAFGDGALMIERYIQRPRHIEVQILGDQHGNVVHLFERECSIQRRHQKIIEEAPSPALTPEMRAQMGAAAVALTKSIGYTSAGTVEFILAPSGEFYFLEVNTRLQVEHPVTECITGLDLVREQLLIAQGEKLSFDAASMTPKGAAVECRLYAEDPANQFLPCIGPVLDFHWPAREGLRPTPLPSGVQCRALVFLNTASPGRGEPDADCGCLCGWVCVRFGTRKDGTLDRPTKPSHSTASPSPRACTNTVRTGPKLTARGGEGSRPRTGRRVRSLSWHWTRA